MTTRRQTPTTESLTLFDDATAQVADHGALADVYAKGGLEAARHAPTSDEVEVLSRSARVARAAVAHKELTEAARASKVSADDEVHTPDSGGEARRDNWQSGGALMNNVEVPPEQLAKLKASLEAAKSNRGR